MSIFVRYSSTFQPYRLSFPIQWAANPYNNKNWMHHFSSLRWLPTVKKLTDVERILNDFYDFHCVRKQKNPYYNQKTGDHTAAIRLGILTQFWRRFADISQVSGQSICQRLLAAEVVNLQLPTMYREGHNHGLMVDLALLRFIEEVPEKQAWVDVDLVLARSSATVDAMWHSSGLSKEHSVSYQEYNLPLTVEYFERLESLGLQARAQIDLAKVLDESRRFLGFALRGNGEYFPLGDSFRLPNEKILNKVFGLAGQPETDAASLLAPAAAAEGVYANEHFFIYRRRLNGQRIHFAATCCWDSHNHKQNDELSFCLEVDGVTLFDDPGYTEFMPWEDMLRLKNEVSHSTIIMNGQPWSDVQAANGRSKITEFSTSASGFRLLMTMERYAGYAFTREIVFADGELTVSDRVAASTPLNGERFQRSFVFGYGLTPIQHDDVTWTLANEQCEPVAALLFSASSASTLEPIQLVARDRRLVHESVQLRSQSTAPIGESNQFNFPQISVRL